jgi:hypothetical protein
MKAPGTTNDHIVPVMYLKRFAVPKSGGHQIEAALVDNPSRTFRANVRDVGAAKGFYWGVDPEEVPHHQMEELLSLIETAATPAFRYLLDQGKIPSDNALPNPWPTRPDVRTAMSWWLAAQVLRTAPQRDRLWRLNGEGLELPSSLNRANPHLLFIIKGIAPLARLISRRPWGVGVSSLCLFTSDVPVQIINARDDDDPIHAATYWDLYMPLDPHRFLYLPGKMHESRRELIRDHLINLPGGLAIPLNQLMVETAHRHLLWHPAHDPRSRSLMEDASRMRELRSPTAGSQTLVSYAALPMGYGVERRWLEKHTWEQSDTESALSDTREPEDAVGVARLMMRQISEARDEFDGSP